MDLVMSEHSKAEQSSYSYTKIPKGNYFRYLILDPCADDEPLRCSLHISLIAETSFEALSYVWGSYTKDREIICNGQTLKITTNLHDALRRLKQDSPRVLWADSICINQDDLEEKALQVTMMGQVFRSAYRTLIFVGSDDAGCGEHVCTLVADVSAIVQDGLHGVDTDGSLTPFLERDHPISQDERWRAVGCLFQQPWFRRGWVVQEAALAQNGWVIWDQAEFSWDALMQTHIWSLYRAPSTYRLTGIMGTHGATYLHFHSRLSEAFTGAPDTLSFLDLLDDGRDLQISDPRDRLFAFADIARMSGYVLSITPNYKESHLHSYHQFARDHIRATKDMILLNFVLHNDHSLTSGIPTWVPRWDIASKISTPTNSNGRFQELTSRDSTSREPTLLGDSILRTKGVLLDEIFYTSDILYKQTMTLEMIGVLVRTLSDVSSQCSSPPSELVGVLLDALICGEFEGDLLDFLECKAFCIDYLEMVKSTTADISVKLPSASDAEHPTVTPEMYYSNEHSHDSRVILTRKGYIGLAPSVSRVGDTCAIIFGCTFPCVLRRSNHSSQFSFIGMSYITGKHVNYDEEETLFHLLGSEESKDWAEWDVEVQIIDLC